MRIALLADIHSNILIFEKVLKDLEKEYFDEIIFLGDYVTDGPASSQVLNLVKKTGTHVILGNREKYILNFDESRRGYINYDTIADTYDSLSKEDIKYIKSLKEFEYVDLNGIKTLLIHGDNFFKYGVAREDFYEKMLENYDFDLCIYGHTHRWDDTLYKGRKFINPGALVQSSDTPTFKYGILNIGDIINLESRELPVRDYFKELVDYYKKTEYYKKHEIWCNLTLLLTRDAINYPNEFIKYFNSKIDSIDANDKKAFNDLYKKCYEEYIKNIELF